MGPNGVARAEGPWGDLALHSIGWKAFQDLCAQVCEDVLRRPVQIYRDAQDGGQDAVFLTRVGGRSRDATVQCKHSSDERRRLRLGDLTPELAAVEALVRAGQADTYVLMTSMGVDAPVAHKIKDALRARGVKRPYVFGREWLIRRIRTSSRLRALVPQVYGLGDLAAILDERMVSRTRALLDQWLPKLRLYVPTEAHRAAVRALNEHGAVLLLGNPSAGKSTIGAILSTIASEDEDHTVLHLTSPRDFEAGWNPSDRKRFFWIDDAFGPNVMRDEYVQDWSSAFRKVQAAIGHGNRFVLTSRRHIYERARPLLGQRNLAAFADGRAVVDVGTLTAGEKAQILYNHIAFGEQTQGWKRAVKPHLAAIANVETFLPGVAERLADPAFTRGLATTPGELLRFMREPREHLAGTIRALDEQLRAALILIYVHRGTLAADQWGDDASAAVADLLGVRLAEVRNRIAELKGSFAVARADGGGTWSFAHPTIADALTEILGSDAHMISALLRGIRPTDILSGFVCEGMPWVRDAGVIPVTMNEIVAGRIAGLEGGSEVDRSLLSFLAFRASDDLLARVLRIAPGVLRRGAWRFHRAVDDPWITVLARAHSLGMLPEQLRAGVVTALERAALSDFDLSFLAHREMLAVFAPHDLLALGYRLRTHAVANLPDLVSELADAAEADDDPESYFSHVEHGLVALEGLGALDADAMELVEQARELIAERCDALRELWRARRDDPGDRGDDETDAGWRFASAIRPSERVDPAGAADWGGRSVFSDVDGR